MLQALTLTHRHIRGQAEAWSIDRRTQHTICFGVEQLLPNDNSKAP